MHCACLCMYCITGKPSFSIHCSPALAGYQIEYLTFFSQLFDVTEKFLNRELKTAEMTKDHEI